jgi:hypothetical protein
LEILNLAASSAAIFVTTDLALRVKLLDGFDTGRPTYISYKSVKRIIYQLLKVKLKSENKVKNWRAIL